MAAEPRKATQGEIALSLRTLAQFSHDTARARGKIDGTSNTGEEIGRVMASFGCALKAHEDNDREGMIRGLSNGILRALTLSDKMGIDIGGEVLRRALENADKIKKR